MRSATLTQTNAEKMGEGPAEQVDGGLLSVNPAEAQQDYIIVTANHQSPCQPHL